MNDQMELKDYGPLAAGEADECPLCGTKTELRATHWDDHGSAMEEAYVCPVCGPVQEMLEPEPIEKRFPQGDPTKKAPVPPWIKSLMNGMQPLELPANEAQVEAAEPKAEDAEKRPKKGK